MTDPEPRPSRPRRGGRGTPQVEEVLDLLYRRRWIIVLAVLVGGAAAAAYALTRTPVYRTSALVLVDLDRAERGDEGGPLVGPDLFAGSRRTVHTELFVLNASRGIRERVRERLGDAEGRLPPGGVSFSLAERNVTSGIRIDAVSTDPEAAAALANAYADEYVAQTRIASRSYLTATREFLEEQAGRLRARVGQADASVEGRMSSAGAASLGSGELLSQLSTLRAQLDEARIDRQMRANRLATIEAQLEDITPALADRVSSRTNQRLETVTRELTEEEARLRTYEEREARGAAVDEAAARALRSRIAALEREKRALGSRYAEEVMGAGGIETPSAAFSYVADLRGQAAQERIEISGLDGRVSQLQSRIGRVSAELGRSPSQTVSLERAEMDRATASETYASVVGQLEEVRVQEASEPGYARVLRGARAPQAPAGLTWSRSVGLGLLAGLLLGVGLAVARDRLDTRVYKPEHVTALGVQVLEAVPDLGPVIRDALGGAASLPVGGRDLAATLVTVHAPLSPASETYRHLRTAVQFSRPDTVIATVVVTSAGAGEGKSTTAANSAIAFAQGGRRTALVDADLRRPQVHELFGASVKNGLYQLVVGPPSPDELRGVLEAEFATPVANLYAVPSGAIAVENADLVPDDDVPGIDNPADVIGSPGLRATLEALRGVVDVIVIDTPPVLVATDAVLLSTQADATILVTSAGGSKTGDIEQALAHLDDVGGRVVGAVLNRFSLDKALGYAYTYGHYSRYGAYSKYSRYSSSGARAARTPAASGGGERGRRGQNPDAR